jgi:nucleotide-binding universal stress UspA family protein
MYRKILVANDGSPGALKALAGAIEMAKRDGAALHMITVEELPRFPASIDEVDEAGVRRALAASHPAVKSEDPRPDPGCGVDR